MTDIYSRQSFLGPDARNALAVCNIAIIGLGGGGSHIAQQLAYLGVQHLQLFDSDTAEFSNLNRLIGASLEDARAETPKVEVARRMVTAINPEISVSANPCAWQLAAPTIRQADVIVSCVDSYATRQDIESTARRYLIPLVDIGMDVFVTGGQHQMAGQVILSLPNGPCMRCLGFLNDDTLRREAQLYGAAGGRPQVVWANGALASIAVGLVVDLLTGWSGIQQRGEYLHFDGNKNLISRSPRLEYAPATCSHYPPRAVGDPVFR
jgi:molybdopterin-synthase adenylyltransferase